MIDLILNKVNQEVKLTKSDAITLLSVENKSPEFYKLISKANELSRTQYSDKGYIFTQIGINSDPCTGNCKFCSLSSKNYSVEKQDTKSLEDILSIIKTIDFMKVSALFLMTTADYDKDVFINIGKEVKKMLPKDVTLVSNIGDFNEDYAIELKNAGFGAVYHIVRLREGVDTDIPKEQRINTLDSIKKAGLDLYYCIEPIGREHTYEEIADEMIRARDYQVDVMAIMGRIGVKNTKFEGDEPLSQLELTKIAAIARLVTNPQKSMNIHEPHSMTLLAGINQLYAEIGFNPRDTKVDTEKGRGYTVDEVAKMLRDAEYNIMK